MKLESLGDVILLEGKMRGGMIWTACRVAQIILQRSSHCQYTQPKEGLQYFSQYKNRFHITKLLGKEQCK